MIKSAFIDKCEILNVVPEFVEDMFLIDRNRVKEQIEPICQILSDDIVCFIEFPYVEKFYRDSYYNFYSKKHNPCQKNSMRLSFFKKVENIEKKYFNSDYSIEIEESFLGYITLRPTTYRLIGYSFISPKALSYNNFVTCLNKKTISVNGSKLSTYAFPYGSQDNESITCSEISILNTADYFSNKYPDYSTILPSQINKILSKQSYQRQLPSIGLQTESISYVLKKIGFGSIVYSSDKKDEKLFESKIFKEILFMYVESGIPIIATLSSKNSHHAILVIGRENIDSDIIYKKKNHIPKRKNEYCFSSAFNKLLVMNDNRAPYEMVDYEKPMVDSENEDYEFKSFIVPLYPKVHLDAYQFKLFFFEVKALLEKYFEEEDFKFTQEGEEYVYRYYLTSSKSYKSYIVNSKGISDKFKTLIICKSMPKFIWVGEIIKGNKIGKEQSVESIIVLDATESGLNNHLIFASTSKNLILKNDSLFDEMEFDTDKEEKCRDKECTSKDKNKEVDTKDNNNYRLFDFNNENFITFANNLKGEHTKWQN